MTSFSSPAQLTSRHLCGYHSQSPLDEWAPPCFPRSTRSATVRAEVPRRRYGFWREEQGRSESQQNAKAMWNPVGFLLLPSVWWDRSRPALRSLSVLGLGPPPVGVAFLLQRLEKGLEVEPWRVRVGDDWGSG